MGHGMLCLLFIQFMEGTALTAMLMVFIERYLGEKLNGSILNGQFSILEKVVLN
jgi:hypothetical protein